MQLCENKLLNESVYREKLDCGLNVIVIPKKGIRKKFVAWATNYGSNDNVFKANGDNEVTKVPNGVAHYLEHKMFEQRNGVNSLDVLTSLGVNANAFTTNEYTCYLFECTNNFYKALDEFMDYVQNPYFTDENVNKERGIIAQEIGMYDDNPDFRVYLNCMKAMYHNNPIRIDIAGTVESIQDIDKDILYKCYNSFYHANNMILVVAGDFEPNEIIKEINDRIIWKKDETVVERIIEPEDDSVAMHEIVANYDVSKPLFAIGFKDKRAGKRIVELSELDNMSSEELKANSKEIIKREVGFEILLDLLLSRSSKLYKELEESKLMYGRPSTSYEYGRDFAYVLITGQSDNPREFKDRFIKGLNEIKKKGLDINDFNRLKKKNYGMLIREYDDAQIMAKMFLRDSLKGVDSFDYLDVVDNISFEYVNNLLNNVLVEDKMVISIIESK